MSDFWGKVLAGVCAGLAVALVFRNLASLLFAIVAGICAAPFGFMGAGAIIKRLDSYPKG